MMLQDNEVAVKKTDLKKWVNQIEELKQERKQLYDATIKSFEVIGLIKDGEMKLGKDFSFMELIRAVKPTLMTLIYSAMSKDAQDAIAKKFAYIKELMPLFMKIKNEIEQK